MPFYLFFFGWEGSPTKIDYRKKGTLVLTSLLEDLHLEPNTHSCPEGCPAGSLFFGPRDSESSFGTPKVVATYAAINIERGYLSAYASVLQSLFASSVIVGRVHTFLRFLFFQPVTRVLLVLDHYALFSLVFFWTPFRARFVFHFRTRQPPMICAISFCGG